MTERKYSSEEIADYLYCRLKNGCKYETKKKKNTKIKESEWRKTD